MKVFLPLKTMQDAVLFDESAQNFVDRPDLMPAYTAHSPAMAEAGVLAGGEAPHPTHNEQPLPRLMQKRVCVRLQPPSRRQDANRRKRNSRISERSESG